MPRTKIMFPHKISVNLGDIHMAVIQDYMEKYGKDQSSAIRDLLLHGLNYVHYVGSRKESTSETSSDKEDDQRDVTELVVLTEQY